MESWIHHVVESLAFSPGRTNQRTNENDLFRVVVVVVPARSTSPADWDPDRSGDRSPAPARAHGHPRPPRVVFCFVLGPGSLSLSLSRARAGAGQHTAAATAQPTDGSTNRSIPPVPCMVARPRAHERRVDQGPGRGCRYVRMSRRPHRATISLSETSTDHTLHWMKHACNGCSAW